MAFGVFHGDNCVLWFSSLARTVRTTLLETGKTDTISPFLPARGYLRIRFLPN